MILLTYGNQTKGQINVTSPYGWLITCMLSVLRGVNFPVIVNPSNRTGILFTHHTRWGCRASLSTGVRIKKRSFLHAPDSKVSLSQARPSFCLPPVGESQGSCPPFYSETGGLSSAHLSTNMLYSVVTEQYEFLMYVP